MILDNSNSKVQEIVEEFGGVNSDRLTMMLQSLVRRVEMDIHNAFNRAMSDVQIEIRSLPMPEDED